MRLVKENGGDFQAKKKKKKKESSKTKIEDNVSFDLDDKTNYQPVSVFSDKTSSKIQQKATNTFDI